jgi:hypothetical protein
VHESQSAFITRPAGLNYPVGDLETWFGTKIMERGSSEAYILYDDDYSLVCEISWSEGPCACCDDHQEADVCF